MTRTDGPPARARSVSTLPTPARFGYWASPTGFAPPRRWPPRMTLVVAGVIIAGPVTWDLAGMLPLPLGVLRHEGSTVLVGLNGLRLL